MVAGSGRPLGDRSRLLTAGRVCGMSVKQAGLGTEKAETSWATRVTRGG